MAVNDSPTPPRTPSGARTPSGGRAPAGTRSPSGARRPDPQFEPPVMSIEGIRNGCLGSAASKIVLGLLLLVFAGGVVFTGLGSNGFSGINGAGDLGGPGGNIGSGTSNETAATIGGATVTEGQLNLALANLMQTYEGYGLPMDNDRLLTYRQSTLQNLTNALAMQQDATKQGFTPSSADIDKTIDTAADDYIKQKEGNNAIAYRREVESQGQTVPQVRADFIAKADHDVAAQKWAVDKLEAKIKADNKVTPEDYTRSQTKINVQQIIIQPKAAMPAMPALPGPKGGKVIPAKPAQPAETEEQARARANQVLKQLGTNPSAAQFAALAKTASDDLYTKAKGGDLGFKVPDQLGLPIPVSDELVTGANFSKNLVGPLQDPATKYFYILHIIGRKSNVPKDYNKKKAEYLKTFEGTRDDAAWQKYQDKVSKEAKVDISDPAVLAFKAQNDPAGGLASLTGPAADRTRQSIIDNYELALEGAGSKLKAAINVQLAPLYTQNKQPDKTVTALQEAVKADPSNVQTQLSLVYALQANKQNKEALTQLTQASQTLERNPPQAPPYSMGGPDPADALHRQIAGLYDEFGKKALAQQERTKIKPAAPAGMGGMGGMGGIQGLPPGARVVPSR